MSDIAQVSTLFKTQLPPSTLLQRVSSERGLRPGFQLQSVILFLTNMRRKEGDRVDQRKGDILQNI